ncbi:MAG: hypothetical protein ACYTEV_09115, partial [Planctomycetota bacterium]
MLGSTVLVTSIGLGALAVARVRSHASIAEGDLVGAREAARGMQELALRRLVTEPRANLPEGDGAWLESMLLDGVTATVTLVDPEDGNPAAGDADPLEVVVAATRGEVVQRNSVTVRISEHADSLTPRLLAGGDITLDADSSVAGSGIMRTAGSFSAGSAPVHLDAVAAGAITGTAMRGLAITADAPDVWPDPAVVLEAWDGRAVAIAADSLPSEPPPLPPMLHHESFEHPNRFMTEWNGMGCAMERRSVADAPDGNHVAWIGWCGSPAVQWWIHHWVNANRIVPRLVAVVRPDPPGNVAEFQMELEWDLWAGGPQQTDRSAVVRSEGGWVELGVTCTAPSHEFSGSMNIHMVSGSSNFVVDHVRVYDASAWTDSGGTPRLLERVRLAPDSNPFGETSPDGVYLIDLDGEDLVIRDCVIEGTLLLSNPGPGTRIEGSVAWRPVVSGDPILVVAGTSGTPAITIATDAVPLVENTLGADLDGDGELTSVIRSRLEGIVLVGGDLTLGGRPRIEGSVIASGDVAF